MKTLVFVQSTILAESSASSFSERLETASVTLTEDEARWHALASEEMGARAHCYLQLEDDESLFRRRDGIDVLFATSTLAQGMNLPSEVVIISGDSRFDPGTDKLKQLEAHELLNAAGRAGRAGEGAQGFVLVVPSRLIDFDAEKSQINQHWMNLKAIFEQRDQCLVIDDPLVALLDQIHQGIVQHGLPAYLLSKLPISTAGSDDPLKGILTRSFGAFRARKRGDTEWVQTRIAAAAEARQSIETLEQDKWIENVSASTGLPAALLWSLVELSNGAALTGPTVQGVSALLAWLRTAPLYLMDLVRPENLEGLFGEQYKKLPTELDRAEQALSAIELLLPLWMTGRPLAEMEASFLENEQVGKCEYARHFVSRIVPDLSFLASLPARLLSARNKASGVGAPISLVLATLGSAVREGCNSPDVLATRLNCGPGVSRVGARGVYDKIYTFASASADDEDFEGTRARMRGAQAAWTINQMSA
jgi:hypothetical protein